MQYLTWYTYVYTHSYSLAYKDINRWRSRSYAKSSKMADFLWFESRLRKFVPFPHRPLTSIILQNLLYKVHTCQNYRKETNFLKNISSYVLVPSACMMLSLFLFSVSHPRPLPSSLSLSLFAIAKVDIMRYFQTLTILPTRINFLSPAIIHVSTIISFYLIWLVFLYIPEQAHFQVFIAQLLFIMHNGKYSR